MITVDTPLLRPTSQVYEPVVIESQEQLQRLFDELRGTLLGGQRLSIAVHSSRMAAGTKSRLQCVDCGASGHASRRYGGCRRRQTGQQRLTPTPPPRSGHQAGPTILSRPLLTPPSSQEPSPESLVQRPAARQALLAALSPLVERTTPGRSTSSRGPTPKKITPRRKKKTPRRTAPRRDEAAAIRDTPEVHPRPESPHSASGGLRTPDWLLPDNVGRWSPSWELQPLSPDMAAEARERFPWAWTEDASQVDFDALSPADVRLLWCAMNTCGVEPPCDEDLQELLWNKVEELHASWNKEDERLEDRWTVVAQKRRRRYRRTYAAAVADPSRHWGWEHNLPPAPPSP